MSLHMHVQYEQLSYKKKKKTITQMKERRRQTTLKL